MLKKWTADKLFDISNAYWKSCTFHAAIQLKLFTIIGDRCLTAEQIANAGKFDIRALKMLLEALVSMELLIYDEEKYSNNISSKELLDENSPTYIGYIAIHHHNIIEQWSNLKQSIITGKPISPKIPQDTEGEELWWKACTEGMLSLAIGHAKYLSKKIDLSNRKNLLDLGGGPGTYAIQFCKENPNLKATIFDIPVNQKIADRTIKKFDAEKQVKFVAGDFYSLELEHKFDVIWISHVIHGENEKNTQKLIKIAMKYLEHNGILMIHDYFLNDNGSGPLHPSLFSLNMLLVTKEGKAYKSLETINMMKNAGLVDVNHVDYKGELQSSIIVGYKK